MKFHPARIQEINFFRKDEKKKKKKNLKISFLFQFPFSPFILGLSRNTKIGCDKAEPGHT